MIKPQDLSISTCQQYGTWGSDIGVCTTITHIPTSISVSCVERSAHKARLEAFAQITKLLEINTDVFKQMELF